MLSDIYRTPSFERFVQKYRLCIAATAKLSDIKSWQPVQYIRFSCSPLRKLFETTDSAMLSDI
jgi:hypothetical protein